MAIRCSESFQPISKVRRKTHFILVLALAAFRLLAQPALPATNQTFAPIANPYSGSWIFYTTNAVSGLGFLNGASIPYVMTASNNVAAYAGALTNRVVFTNDTTWFDAKGAATAATNGLANTNWVISYADTNGAASYFSKQATNGFTTMVYSNPAAFLLTNTLPALTNGFVTATVTNGLATTAYVNTATNGLVTSAVTNGLATTNWVSMNAITTAQLPTGWTTNGLGRVLSSYTNVVIDLSPYTNAEPLSFFIALTNNTTFAFVTNAPPGKSFFIEVQQGTAGSMWKVNFKTNLTTTAAYWQPPAFGQFLAMPTNSSNSRQFIDVRIGNNGTNAFEWQNNIVR